MPKRKPKSRRVKAPTTRALINKLDRIFSRYVRLRDADENGTVTCVTCGKLAHWKEVHAGHFVKRQHMAVRFHTANVHPQCCRCNLYMGGCQDEYAAYIVQTYGYDMLTQLLQAKREAKKWTRGELEDMIHANTELVKTLEARCIV